jgi:hypothetical protein
MDIAAQCRRLSDFHGLLDLADRVRDTVELQRQQREALVLAAEEIERGRQRVQELTARVAELECCNSIRPST